jgi:hypothetical protein
MQNGLGERGVRRVGSLPYEQASTYVAALYRGCECGEGGERGGGDTLQPLAVVVRSYSK